MSVLPGSGSAVYAFGPFVLDRDRRLLARDGAAVSLTPKAFDLLVALVESGGTALSKDALISRLWPDTAVEENNLAFQISTLRKALGADGAGSIATLPGRGYQFVAPLQRVESTPARRATAPAGEVQSLAVLPFKPLAAERDEALELGMADTLITRLSPMPGVTVRPISAVRRYCQLEDDPLMAGQTLGVDAVLDGSIQRRGARIRVTVRLLRIAGGKQLWASQFDDDADDLFALQDLVADRVARAIVPALTRSAETQLTHRTTDDLEAYDLYLKGRYWSYSDPVRAEEFYRKAVARDPRFATAWAALADVALIQGRYGYLPSAHQSFADAREAAMRAVAIDPDLAAGHAALAQVYSDYDWDWPRGEEEYRCALELNPSSDVANGHYAYLLLFRGEFENALRHARRAIEIDPVSPIWGAMLAFVLDSMGRHDEAVTHCEELLRLHPRFIPALLHLGLAHTNAGNPAAGLAAFEEGLSLQPGWLPLLALKAFAHAAAGDREAALSLLHEVEARSAHESAPIQNLALAWTALGDHDRAFFWLEHGYRERHFLLRVILVQPGFAPLRDDPRYADLVRRMGLG